jgi:hypothetical protein
MCTTGGFAFLPFLIKYQKEYEETAFARGRDIDQQRKARRWPLSAELRHVEQAKARRCQGKEVLN